jgi:hypothetical protein
MDEINNVTPITPVAPENFPPINDGPIVAPQIGINKSKGLLYIIIGVTTLLLAIFSVCAFLLFNLNQDQKNRENAENNDSNTTVDSNENDDNASSSNDSTTNEEPEATDGLVAWIKYENNNKTFRLMAWKDGVEKEIFVNTTASDGSGWVNLQSIPNNNEIYFGVGATSNLVIKKYSFVTDSISDAYVGSYVRMVTPYDSSHLLYVKDNGVEAPISLYLYDTNSKIETKLVEINIAIPGRGVSAKDSFKMSVSADKSKFLFINTAEYNNPAALSTYAYSIKQTNGVYTASLVATIPQATHPIWKDNSTIIYLSLDAAGGVYEYNVDSKANTLLTNVKTDGYSFSYIASANKLLYSADAFDTVKMGDTPGTTLYLYDYEMKVSSKLFENANGFWINKDLMWVTTFRACDVNNEECMGGNWVPNGAFIAKADGTKTTYQNADSGYTGDGMYKFWNL